MNANRIAAGGRALVEGLEARLLFSADLLGDVVYVTGTRRADVIRLSFRTVRSAAGGTVDQLYVLVNDEESAFNIGDFARVIVKANRDADRLRIDQSAGELPPVGFVSDAGAGATLVRGVLDVEGGAGNDRIQVSRDLHKGGNYVVDVNGTRSTFSTLAVSRILVFGNRRGDEILIGQTGPHVGLGVVAVGGGGDDVVRGGDGNDTIVADARDRDTLWGGDGDDSFTGAFVIDGGNGNDTVAGYAGIGTFTGGAGYDRLISGFMRSQLPSHFLDFDSAEDTYAIFPP